MTAIGVPGERARRHLLRVTDRLRPALLWLATAGAVGLGLIVLIDTDRRLMAWALLGAVAVAAALLVMRAIHRRIRALERRDRDLRVLEDHADAQASASDPAQALAIMLAASLAAVDAELAEFWSVGGDGLELIGRCTPGDCDVGSGASHATSRESAPGPDLLACARDARAALTIEADGSWAVGVPAMVAGTIVGIVRLAGDGPATDTAGIGVLQRLVDQGALSWCRTGCLDRATTAGALAERGRLSRELHDGLAQVLAYVSTKACATRLAVRDGHVDDAVVMLAAVEEAAREASVDLRESLLAIHPAQDQEWDLCRCLRSYFRTYERMSGVSVDYRLPADEVLRRVSGHAGLQLVRIIGEALANVRKHAHATRAMISLRLDGDMLDLRIEDDGQGFDPRRGPSDGSHLGLRTMQERAQAVGGTIELVSGLGLGTRVSVRVPLRPDLEQLA